MAKSKSLELLKKEENKLVLKRTVVSATIPIPINTQFQEICKELSLNKSALIEKLITNWMLEEGYLY